MIFNSYIFVFLFLPVVVSGYYICVNLKKHNLANIVLLIGSIFFYAYAGWKGLIILSVSIILNYIFYRLMRLYYQPEKINIRKIILCIGIACNLIMLMYFKYYNFFIENLNLVFGTSLGMREVILPVGISFVTFQQIAFLVDAYRMEADTYNIFDYSLFISYFPHISSGPIILHKDLLPLLETEKKMDWDKFATGIYMFVMGLGKKVLIADMFADAVNWGYSNISLLNSTSALFVSIAYTIQIYFDFSGYSDMAIGISRMLQLDLPINFNSPYKADTILEFWDRWHITLTRFFTKYLYIPLGGNRKGNVRTCLNTMIVFFFSGLWHGASWTFILWGGLHGCFVIFTKQFKTVFDKIPRYINRLITLMFVNFTWILFRAGSFDTFKQMMNAITNNKWGKLNEDICAFFRPVVLSSLEQSNVPYWLCAVTILLVAGCIIFKCKNVQERAEHMEYSLGSCVWLLLVTILSILSFSGVNTFIYSYF